MTATLMRNTTQDRIVPIIKDNPSKQKLPIFLGETFYLDFDLNDEFQMREELLQTLHGVKKSLIPPLGPNPYAKVPEQDNEYFLTPHEEELLRVWEKLNDWQKGFVLKSVKNNKHFWEEYEIGPYRTNWENNIAMLDHWKVLYSPRWGVFVINDEFFDFVKKLIEISEQYYDQKKF